MKNVYCIFLFVIFLSGCNTSKPIANSEKTSPLSNPEKKDKTHQQIAPATCYLSVTDIELFIDSSSIKAKIVKIHGYGAGFSISFHVNQEIELNISDEHLKEIKNQKNISCVISQVTGMNNNTSLKLIELK
ncbi:hypothetical protein [Marinifilum flexuosum]|uniref:Uncharacterized protein n=1 Tax=Marinifilum flexuosum TaxID=1117708 RepID=A0A419X9A6_9BACT|nr:hypothetical protein [Marinifilum flexuosum]RKE04226.1 hypothetical protein BXY64_1242 [Marinifilum flexuosum]